MKVYLAPTAATLGLFGWWLYALTSDIHFPTHGKGGSLNALGFNIVIIILVLLCWVGAACVDIRRSSE